MEEGAGGCHPQVLGIKLPQDLGWWNMHDRTEGIWGMGGGRPRQQQGHGKDEAELRPHGSCGAVLRFQPHSLLVGAPPPQGASTDKGITQSWGSGCNRLPQEAGKGH